MDNNKLRKLNIIWKENNNLIQLLLRKVVAKLNIEMIVTLLKLNKINKSFNLII